MFSSPCSGCSTVIMTRTDQSNNINFRCKSCVNHEKNFSNDKKIDAKYGPKVIYPQYSNISSMISKIIPSYHQNDVRCDRCHKRFFSDIVPQYCTDCTEFIKCDHNCSKCNITIDVTPRAFKKHDNMCINCFNSTIYPFKCSYCNNTFLDSHNTYNSLNESVCHDCRDSITYKNKL